MKPNFPDLNKFEYFASNEEPSLEGSSIVSMQTIEHLFNMFAKRDPLNNSMKAQQLSTVVTAATGYKSALAKRPVPLDHLHQLYSYAKKAITQIAANPSRKLVKEAAYILPNQLKSPRTKTMNWIANQPGRNIREKLAGKRVLAEKNVFVVETKENQVYLRVMNQLAKEFQNRLELGIQAGAYDAQPMDQQRVSEIQQFLTTYKKVRYSELGDINISKPIIEPNNKLISDKYYAPIWRLYNELNNRKYKIHENGQHLIQRFEDMLFVYLVVELSTYAALKPVDFPMLLSDIGKRIVSKAYEEKDKLSFIYFFKSNVQDDEQVIVETIQIGKRRLICRKVSGEQVIIPASAFESLGQFGKIRVGDHLSLQTYTVQKEVTSKEACLMTLTLEDNEGKTIQLAQLEEVNEANFTSKELQKITFEIEQREADFESRRGIPISCKLSKNGQQSVVETFADMEGINELIKVIVSNISKVVSFDQVKYEDPQVIEEEIENISMDFTRTVASLVTNEHHEMLENDYLIRYDNKDQNEHHLFQPDRRFLHEFNQKIYSFEDILDVDSDDYKWSVTYFTKLMQQLRARQNINPAVPFIYMVPDNIDEFAQVDIKKTLNIYYKKNFPIWRSVGAALTIEQHINQKQLKRLIAIDTQGPQASATQLMLVEKNKKPLFMHFPSYEMESNTSRQLTFKYICESYLLEFIKKFKLTATPTIVENILTSGVVEQCLTNKESQLIVCRQREAPFILHFDKELYEDILRKWFRQFRNFLLSLKRMVRSNEPVTAFVILVDFDIDEALAKRMMTDYFADVPVYFYNTLDVLQTVSQKMILQKLMTSEPVWYEYLPDLSLDVIREGTYGSLQLIKDKFIGNTMGSQELFEINETLILPRNQNEYQFPLKRGGSLGGEINAVIKNPVFPLKEDLEMALAIEYKYGYENSYRLTLKPIKPHALIKEIEVQWVQEGRKKVNDNVHHYLEVPDGIMTTKEIAEAQAALDRTFDLACTINELFSTNDIVRTTMLFELKNSMFRSVYVIRKLLRQPQKYVKQYIEKKVQSAEYAYLRDMRQYIPDKIQSGSRKDVFEQLFKQANRFVYSFGEYISKAQIDNIIQISNKNRTFIDSLYSLLYRNSDYKPLVVQVEQFILERPKTAIRSLRDSMWRDPDIIHNLYKQNYKIVESMYAEIKKELKRSIRHQSVQNILYTRDCLEVLLAMLAVRNERHFEFMQVGSPQMMKLAKNIRDVDVILYDSVERTTPTLLQFKLEKPEGLWKLSDIGFVLNAYLTGDVKENLISVRGISEDKEEGKEKQEKLV